MDIVERYVPLRKAGANFSACCPFHSEKTPSFTVSPTKQFYHCFGCGEHGTAIGFVMQYSGIGFVEAVEELAGGLGMPIPRDDNSHHRQASERKAPLTELMAKAAKYYREQLKASAVAIDYFKSRGLSGEIAARFGLGYAPDGWQNIDSVFPDYKAPALLECGLVIENDQGRRYDRFRGRVMFPILDQRGNVIGFGGRVLGEGEPKYLNSPETPLFEKGRELYGLTQARQAIRDSDTVIVVEGYMDVVALAQHGIGNAVATLGTATTATHVQKLLRQASRVIFCFDGDRAGRKAAWRALEASLEPLADDKTVGFLFLPPEHDPDSFVRQVGEAEFRRLALQPTTLTEFLMRELKAEADLTNAEGRARLIHEAKPLLLRIGAPGVRLQLVKQLAEASAIAQAEVEGQCGLKPLGRRGAPPPPRSRQRPAPRPIDQALLEIVLQQPMWTTRLPLDLISAEQPHGAVLHAIANAIEHGELTSGSYHQLLEFFRGGPHEAVIAEMAGSLASADVDIGELEVVLNDALLRLRQTGIAREIDSLTAKARSAGLNQDERRQLTELLSRKRAGHGLV